MAEIKTILFPTDFSALANSAFPHAESLARAFGAKIILLHVAELEEEDPANPSHSFPALDAFAGEIETERIIIRGHAPYKDILEVSRARACDLIVMATHGRSALSQFFLGGSIAEEVARFSTVPVIIVKADEAGSGESYAAELKEVLYTTDFSSQSAAALPVAASFAEKFNAKLHAIHVIDDDSREFYAASGLSRDDDDFRPKLEDLLRSHVGGLAGGTAVASVHVAEGRAETEIVKFAEANGIDLIAIAARGHGLLEDEILGTTTDRVIRHAHCPVMTVRG